MCAVIAALYLTRRSGCSSGAVLRNREDRSGMATHSYRGRIRCPAQERNREAGLEPTQHEKRKGIFVCAGCDLPLFSSETKFDSRTGWPSFYRPLSDAVGTERIGPCCSPARKCIAAAVAVILDTFSTMAHRPPDYATA